MKNYVQHPIGAIVPAASTIEFDKLVDSLKREGFDDEQPVCLYEGKVLDGWSRYQASKEACVEPVFEEFTGKSPYHFVRARNVLRRHMTTTQIAALESAMIDDLAREANRGRQEIIE